jgi:hypothetical protein
MKRADIALSKNGIGIIFEIKYNGKDTEQALSQAETYQKIIEKNKVQVFAGFNISK